MSQPSYHILSDSIVVSLPGQSPKTFRKSDGRYAAVLAAVKERRDGDIASIISGSSDTTPAGVEFRAGTVYIDGSPVPDSLAQRFAEFKAMGIPNDSLVLFWNKLKRNPNRNSVEMLYQFLDHNGHPITRDGNFIAYRYVKRLHDGRIVDCHTGTVDNSPGQKPEMPRKQVDSDPDRTCSTGYHVAAWEYVKGNSLIVEVEVDPRDVVCVPNDYNGTKMRVCSYRVLEEISSPTDSETAPRADSVFVDLQSKTEVRKDEGVLAKVKSLFKAKTGVDIKDRFKVKAKTGSFVREIQYWSSRIGDGKGTLTVVTAKGEWRYWDVPIVTANKFISAKDQDEFYREKIKGTYEGAKR
jgi:hypothetical protein